MSPIHNWTMLDKALVSIIEHPERYWQSTWFTVLPNEEVVTDPEKLLYSLPEGHSAVYVSESGTRLFDDVDIEDAVTIGKCGTTRCVAGWVAHHDGWDEDPVRAGMVTRDGFQTESPTAALQALGIQGRYSDDAQDVRTHLFAGSLEWPQILIQVAIWAKEDGHVLPAKVIDEIAAKTTAGQQESLW